VLKKKIWANFQRIIELFTQKIVNKLSKLWIWDPGSRIPDPGVKKAPDPDPQHWPDPDFHILKFSQFANTLLLHLSILFRFAHHHMIQRRCFGNAGGGELKKGGNEPGGRAQQVRDNSLGV
jgi:hypothetical protein